MYTHRRFAFALALAVAGTVPVLAQNVISAHSGTVHYFEGDVRIDGQAIQQQKVKFSELKDNGVLTTAQGRAEVLLTPGVFLRVGENSSIKMLDSRLLSTRVEVLSGTVMVESDDPEMSVKDPAVTIVYKDYEIQPIKYGLFELFADTAQLKVYKGDANVAVAGNRMVVKDGRMVALSGATLTAEKFDTRVTDELYFWTRDRAAYVSAANVASARTVSSNGFAGLSRGTMFGTGGWYYNTFLGMYTYLPSGRNIYWSPFGYGFFSPYSVYAYYDPNAYYWTGGGGSRTGGSTGQPVNSPNQISRFGIAANHPTLAAPIRSYGTTLRGGLERGGGMQQSPDFGGLNPASVRGDVGFRGAVNNNGPMLSSGPAFVPAPSAAPAPAAGGDRGPAAAAPRGR